MQGMAPETVCSLQKVQRWSGAVRRRGPPCSSRQWLTSHCSELPNSRARAASRASSSTHCRAKRADRPPPASSDWPITVASNRAARNGRCTLPWILADKVTAAGSSTLSPLRDRSWARAKCRRPSAQRMVTGTGRLKRCCSRRCRRVRLVVNQDTRITSAAQAASQPT